MTSLSKQLDALRSATAQQLTIEKKHVSLLFDKKEAQKLDRETVFKIGRTGLDQLKKLDAVFDSDLDFFKDTALSFQRVLITKDENDSLSAKLDKLLYQMSPYMQHFACQQVLEWLIFQYQIHAYNAETLIMVFLPYHETNVYGKLLAILEFNFSTSKDWAFMERFARKEMPIPFKEVVKAALSSNHSVVTRLVTHLDKGLQVVGDNFLETRASLLFAFYAKLSLALLEDAQKVDETLLAKMIPLIANGLRSPLASFRHASLMIICQLVLVVKLSSTIVQSIIKIILMKLKDNSLSSSLSTLAVICQQQDVLFFSTKGVLKVLHRQNQFGIWSTIASLSSQTDLQPFLKALWNTLISIALDENQPAVDKEAALSALLETSQSEMLYQKQAAEFLSRVIDFHRQVDVSPKFRKNIYAMAARHSDEFNVLCDEWRTRDESFLKSFLDTFELQNLVIIKVKDVKKKRRSRTNSMRASGAEELKTERKSATSRAEEMAQQSEFARRQTFSGDPIKKAVDWSQHKDWSNVSWALDEMINRKSYLRGQLDEYIEAFAVSMIRSLTLDPSNVPSDKLKSVLSKIAFNEKFVSLLLMRYEETGTAAKKSRSDSSGKKVSITNFKDETSEHFDRRLNFVLELLNISDAVGVSANIFKILFELVKEMDASSEGKYTTINHQLALRLLIKLLTNPGKYKVTVNDLQIDSVVDSMRNTHSHHVLRESLSLLTACVKLNPASVTSHVMSVFTFMGSGLLRKDNELTLGIIEQTLQALFVAVLNGSVNKSKDAVTFRLIDVTRIFAASACDIPAHRRARMAQAICMAIGPSNAWVVASVMLEGFCTKWQRSSGDARKKSADQDAFDDIAVEICSSLEPVDQLSAVLDLIQYAIRLGSDQKPPSKILPVDLAIFDRAKHSLPKLRHFRHVTIGVVIKVLSNRSLYERLAKVDDEDLYKNMVPLGKTLMSSSVSLDEFFAAECKLADESKDLPGMRYWISLQARAESVSEKLRNLLPGGVAARLIADVLEDDSTEWRLREKALQLTNAKLVHDGFFYSDGGINESHLIRLASVLNKWISPVRSASEKVVLCQNAAFSLKLVAKRIPRQSDSDVLSETMNKCVETISQWKTLDENMTGNVLLLAGELIRSHNMRSTMLSSEALLVKCLEIISECLINQAAKAEGDSTSSSKLQRVRQQSLSGKKLGSDTLLICSLTCLQRILDQFAAFVSNHMGEILVRFGRLSGRYYISETKSGSLSDISTNKNAVQHRLSMIRDALGKFELRVLPTHFAYAVERLNREEKPLCALFSLLSEYFKMPNRVVIVELREKLMSTVFLPALSYRNLERSPEVFENVCTVEVCVFDSMLRMVGLLTEVNLRSVVSTIVKWAEPALNTSAERSVKIRLVSLYHFANRFYSSFNSLALPYFGKMFEVAPKVLSGCNLTTNSDIRSILLTGKKDTVEGLEADYLIKEVIDFVTNCARHKEFMTTERAECISTVVVDELINTKLPGHESRCVPHIAEAIYRISDAVPDSFGDILNSILLKTRNNRPKIRFRTLLVVEYLFEKVGDGIVPHLPLVMPFLSELLEDENKAVEEQCDRIVRLLQKNFGENIAEGFA